VIEHHERLSHHIQAHGKPVYLWQTLPMGEKEWKALATKIRRTIGKSDHSEDANHGFARLLQDHFGTASWVIVATVPFHPDCQKWDEDVALVALKSALIQAPTCGNDNRVSYSRSWGPVEEASESRYERIGTISDPEAAREHAELWGLSVSVRELPAGNHVLSAVGFSDDPALARQQKEDFLKEVCVHWRGRRAAEISYVLHSIIRREPKGVFYRWRDGKRRHHGYRIGAFEGTAIREYAPKGVELAMLDWSTFGGSR
jgi:hypothetical protein